MRLVFSILGVLALAAGAPAGAAQTTWADPAGLCAGSSPCFVTVGAAVANAGPPPAQVFVFPGTYPESVDLGAMGSAIGGAPGALSVVSVDAAGQPAPGAMIDPGAMGGPGTGPAVFAAGFPGALVLDGLVVRSPDHNGIDLVSGTAAVLLTRMVASDSPLGNGAVALNASGDVRVEQSIAMLNLNSGFVLGTAAGALEVEASRAERNDGDGFSLTAPSISVHDSSADANGARGFVIGTTDPTAVLVVETVEVLANGQVGLAASPLVPGAGFAATSLDGVVAASNQGTGVLVLGGGTITATDLTATANGSVGVGLVGGSVHLSQAVATGNDGSGIGLSGTDVTAEFVTVEGNGGDGLDVVTDSGGGSYSLTEVTALGNGGLGVVAGGFSGPEGFAAGSLTGVEAALNQGAGVAAGAGVVAASRVTAVDNGTVGVGLVGEQRVEASELESAGHPSFGILLAGPDVRLAASSATGNRTGVATDAARVLIEDSAATASGPSAGGPFDGFGFALVDPDRAEVAASRARFNEVGWGLFDPGSPAAGPAALRRELERALAPLAPAPTPLGGPLPQRVTVLTSLSEGNTEGSMELQPRPGAVVRIGCSDFVDNGPGGLTLLVAGTVDARSNFWGEPSGPSHPGNPGGTGDAIRDAAAGAAGTVLFDPFLPDPASAGDCPVQGVVEIPVLGPAGLALLALLLAGGALALMRLRRLAG